MKKFDVLSAKIYFEGSKKYKYRPILFIYSKGNVIFARKMTSKPPRNSYPGEYQLKDWKQAGLDKPTVVRMSKYVVVNKNEIKSVVGHLSDEDIENIKNLLNTPYKESYNPDDVIDEFLYNYIK